MPQGDPAILTRSYRIPTTQKTGPFGGRSPTRLMTLRFVRGDIERLERGASTKAEEIDIGLRRGRCSR